MKEIENEEKMSKSLIEYYMEEDDIEQNEEERDDGNDKSCISKCCFYLW